MHNAKLDKIEKNHRKKLPFPQRLANDIERLEKDRGEVVEVNKLEWEQHNALLELLDSRETQIKKYDKSIVEQNSEIARLSERNGQLVAQIDAVALEMGSLMGEHQKQIDMLSTEKEFAQKQLEDLRVRNAEITYAEESLQRRLTGSEEDLKRCRTELDKSTVYCQALEEQLREREKKEGEALDSALMETGNELEKSRKKAMDLEKELEEVRGQLRQHKQMAGRMENFKDLVESLRGKDQLLQIATVRLQEENELDAQRWAEEIQTTRGGNNMRSSSCKHNPIHKHACSRIFHFPSSCTVIRSPFFQSWLK